MLWTSDPMTSAVLEMQTVVAADAVWRALTCPQRTPHYLHGLSLRSTWATGAAVEVVHAAPGLGLSGEVLWAQPPARLSYVLAEDSGTATFVCWRLEPAEAGTRILLTVDESGAEDAATLTGVWRDVLDTLVSLLSSPAAP